MNDQRFIELVNLYIDREITAAETAELELEIQSNPRRRATYNQYCKMNRATSLVYDSFRAQATDAAGKFTRPGNVIQFSSAKPKRSVRIGYGLGGLAAAACVAFALVRFSPTQETGAVDVTVAQQQSTPALESRTAATMVATAPAPQVAPSPVTPNAHFASLRANAEADQNYEALLSALRQDEQRGLAEAQLRLMRTPSLFDDGVFDTKQLPASFNQRIFRNQPAAAAQSEFTAFQFQR